MKNFEDIEKYRRTDAARAVAEQWIKDDKLGLNTSDAKMHVFVSCLEKQPFQGLGNVLNLLDGAEDNKDTVERIALGPVWSLMHACEPGFLPILKDAILRHGRFDLCTRADRSNPEFGLGMKLAEILDNERFRQG